MNPGEVLSCCNTSYCNNHQDPTTAPPRESTEPTTAAIVMETTGSEDGKCVCSWMHGEVKLPDINFMDCKLLILCCLLVIVWGMCYVSRACVCVCVCVCVCACVTYGGRVP